MSKPDLMPWETPGGRTVWAECIQESFPVENNVFVPCLGESGIEVLAEYIRERIDHGFDCLIMVSGDRGSGKSTLILQTALELDKNITADSVAFRLEDFARIFKYNSTKKKRYAQVIMDESGHAFHSRDWNNRVQRTVIKHMIISRVKRQIIWEAVPKRSQLDNQLRDMPYLWVHVTEPREFVQGFAVVLTAPSPLQSMWHPERYWVHQFAFMFNKLEGPLWDEYEKRKIEFVDAITEELSKGRASPALAAFDELLYDYHVNQKKSYREIEKIIHRKMSFSKLKDRLNNFSPPKR